MLVQVKYRQLQKYVKLDEVEGWFDFLQFHEQGNIKHISLWHIKFELIVGICFVREHVLGLFHDNTVVD